MRGKAEHLRAHCRARRRGRVDVRSGLAGAVVAAFLTYFFDPRRGRSRRHTVRDRATAAVRRAGRRSAHRARVHASQARGCARGLAHRFRRGPRRELDDAELAHKVESIVFRNRRIPKGRISINAERGAVFLRGELDSPDLIVELERAVRAVPGVGQVENLLHLPRAADDG